MTGVVKNEWEVLGEELVKQYYHLFDNNREQLVALYSVNFKLGYVSATVKNADEKTISMFEHNIRNLYFIYLLMLYLAFCDTHCFILVAADFYLFPPIIAFL